MCGMQFVPIPEKERLQYQVLDFEGGQNPMIVFALQIVLQDQVRTFMDGTQLHGVSDYSGYVLTHFTCMQRLLSVVTKYQNLQHRLVKLQNLPKVHIHAYTHLTSIQESAKRIT